jgi:hypothetical protein
LYNKIDAKSKEPKFIYTAFKPKCFEYSPIKENEQYKKLFFIGMSERGSLFLVLNFLRETFKIKVSSESFKKTFKEQSAGIDRHINKIDDQGNSQVPGYYVEFEHWKMNEEKAREIFETKKKGG